MARETSKDQHKDEDEDDDNDDDWRPVGEGRDPHLFLNITTEDVDDCFVVMYRETEGAFSAAADRQALKEKKKKKATNLLLHSNIITETSVHVHIHSCIYVYIHVLYIDDAFCLELKSFY